MYILLLLFYLLYLLYVSILTVNKVNQIVFLSIDLAMYENNPLAWLFCNINIHLKLFSPSTIDGELRFSKIHTT